jgi:UDP-N-acetylmuramyl pentapeptide synthase
VLTSIGDEHHLSLGNLETTRYEKAQMLRGLAPRGIAILNGDDEQVMAAAAQAQLGQRRVVCYGFGRHNQLRAERLSLDWPRGSEFTLIGPDVALPVRVQLIGAHSVRAALAAFVVARELGIPAETIGARLSGLPPTPGRMQPVVLPSGAVLLRDDFKSALATIEAALDTLAAIPARRRLAVLGEVTEPRGSQHVIYRSLGGRTAGVACRILHIGNRFDRLAQGARRAGLPRQAVSEHASVQEIAAQLRAEPLQEGDVVLLKGRLDQKLGRVALLLTGSAVECTLRSCRSDLPCERCPMCASGWGTRRQVT